MITVYCIIFLISGVATGSLLGGIGFDKIGGYWTFSIASIINIVSVVFFTISYLFIKRSSPKAEITGTSSKTSPCNDNNSVGNSISTFVSYST